MLQYLTSKEVRPSQQCASTRCLALYLQQQSTMQRYTLPATASYVMSIGIGKILLPCRPSRQLLHEASGVICSQDLTSGLVYTC